MSGQRYFIQDTRSFVGDSVVWWRPNRAGYTVNLDEAGEYEESEARSIERNRGTDKPIPVEVARCVASSHVIADRLAKAMRTAERPPEGEG